MKIIVYQMITMTKIAISLTSSIPQKTGPGSKFPRGGGGTLKFSVYIGEADFFGVKILNFRIFLGFQKN